MLVLALGVIVIRSAAPSAREGLPIHMAYCRLLLLALGTTVRGV